MVMLPEAYCIDQTEVTQGQYAAWMNGTPAPSTEGQDAWCTWNDSYVPECDWGDEGRTDYPVTCVDWCDAYAYCAGVGKRLCGDRAGGANDYDAYADVTRSQWYNACASGAANHTYPYGDEYDNMLCNGWDYSVPEDVTEPVATIATCQSSTEGYRGVYDLSGNVREWENACNGWTGQTDYCYLRGGAYYDRADSLQCGQAVDGSRGGNGFNVGFRCCAL